MLPGMNNNPLSGVTTDDSNLGDAKIIDHFDRFELWFAMAWKLLVWVTVAVAIGSLIFFSVRAYLKKSERVLAEKFYTIFADTALSDAARNDKLKQLLADHPNHPSSAYAKLLIADFAADKKQYNEAIQLYGEVFKNGKANAYTTFRAGLNHGYLLEITGKPAEALTCYENVWNLRSVNPAVQLEAGLALARSYYEANNLIKAKEITRQIDALAGEVNIRQIPIIDAYFLLSQRIDCAIARLPKSELPGVQNGAATDSFMDADFRL